MGEYPFGFLDYFRQLTGRTVVMPYDAVQEYEEISFRETPMGIL